MSNKAEITKLLLSAGIEVSAKETLPELNYKLQLHTETQKPKPGTSGSLRVKADPMTGMSTLLKGTLQMVTMELGLPLKKKTKGELLVQMRERIQNLAGEKLNFGRFSDLTHANIVADQKDYLTWAIKEHELKKESMQPRMRALVMFAKMSYGLVKDPPNAEDSEEEKTTEAIPAKAEAKPKTKGQDKSEFGEDGPKPWPQNPQQKNPSQFFIGETTDQSAPGSSDGGPQQRRTYRPLRRNDILKPSDLATATPKGAETEDSESSSFVKVLAPPPQWDGKPENWESFQTMCANWYQAQPVKIEDMSLTEKRAAPSTPQ